jgi:hypothetical protein
MAADCLAGGTKRMTLRFNLWNRAACLHQEMRVHFPLQASAVIRGNPPGSVFPLLSFPLQRSCSRDWRGVVSAARDERSWNMLLMFLQPRESCELGTTEVVSIPMPDGGGSSRAPPRVVGLPRSPKLNRSHSVVGRIGGLTSLARQHMRIGLCRRRQPAYTPAPLFEDPVACHHRCVKSSSPFATARR